MDERGRALFWDIFWTLVVIVTITSVGMFLFLKLIHSASIVFYGG
jgi:hypothetical protein